MDRLASEDHSHIATQEELMSIVVIGGSVRMWWISIRCRQGVNLTSRNHCRLCIASRKRRTKRTMKIGRTVPPHGGNGKLPGGIPIMRLHHKDGLNTDRTGKTCVLSKPTIHLWHESQQEFDAKFIVIISVTVNAVYCHRRGVKSTSPVTENHNKNGYVNYKNFTKTNEDINDDTKYNQQEWHEQSRRARSARVSTAARCLVVFPVLMLSHDPFWLKSFTCLSSSRHVAHVSFSLIFTYLPFYFNLSFPFFFHSSVLMDPDLHTDLDNLDSVENNLRHSAKGSLDAYDVTFSLTENDSRHMTHNHTLASVSKSTTGVGGTGWGTQRWSEGEKELYAVVERRWSWTIFE